MPSSVLHHVTSPNFSPGVLSARAMLCGLSIGIWSARAHVPDVSKDVALRHGAQTEAGSYRKVLLLKNALAQVRQVMSEARREHYFMTLPRADDGYRVLPAPAFDEHSRKMRELSGQFFPAVDLLVQRFDQLVLEARP